MIKGKLIEWNELGKINITKIEITPKGNYRIEILQNNKYYITKPNELVKSIYNDFKKYGKVEIKFSNNIEGSYKRDIY